MRKVLLLLLLPALLLVVGHPFTLTRAQSTTEAPTSATGTERKTSEPYTGDLSVFESPGRDDRLQISRVMDILSIAPGKSVADIGAGSGWFSVRAARRIGAAGSVYAVDINPEAIRYIDKRIKQGTAGKRKDDPERARRPASARPLGGCGAAAEDLSRGRATGRAFAEAAGCAAPRGQGGSHRSQRERRESRRRPRRRDSRGKRSRLRSAGPVRLRQERPDGLLPGLHGATVTSSTADHVVRVRSVKAGRSASEAAPCGLAHAASIAAQSSK